MSNTYFEQVPVEVVKKICKERIQRIRKHHADEDAVLQQSVEHAELANSEQSGSQR